MVLLTFELEHALSAQLNSKLVESYIMVHLVYLFMLPGTLDSVVYMKVSQKRFTEGMAL